MQCLTVLFYVCNLSSTQNKMSSLICYVLSCTWKSEIQMWDVEKVIIELLSEDPLHWLNVGISVVFTISEMPQWHCHISRSASTLDQPVCKYVAG